MADAEELLERSSELSESDRVRQAALGLDVDESWRNVTVYRLLINPLDPVYFTCLGDVPDRKPLSMLSRIFKQDKTIESITFSLRLEEDDGTETVTSEFEGRIDSGGDIKGTFDTRSFNVYDSGVERSRMTVSAHVSDFSMSIDQEKTVVNRCSCGCAGPGALLADCCVLRGDFLRIFQTKEAGGRSTKSANKDAGAANSGAGDA